jgi:UDP-glucose 4-epimerase
MKCLVLGGAGFIGSHLVDVLVREGHSVRVFDLPNNSLQNLRQSIGAIEVVQGDFENISDISPTLDGVDVVIHLISTTLPAPSNNNPEYDVQTNVIGTLQMLREAVRKGVKKIVFSSSGGTVYGIPSLLPIPETHPTNPICSHGITKLTIEKYLALYSHLYGLDCTVLRFGNPYGPRQRIKSVQGAVAVFLGCILRNEEITVWGDGSVSRDYFYIDDLVSAVLKAIHSGTGSAVYNIASGNCASLNEILSIISEVTGKKPRVHYAPPRRMDVPVSCLDITRAREGLGWAPQVSMHEGITHTWKWLKSCSDV